MPKKRSSGGRSKGGKGRSGTVQCSLCGAQVPKDKAKRLTKYSSLVEPRLLKELRASGTQIARYRSTKFYCISCAIHRGVVKIRNKNDRKTVPRRSGRRRRNY